MKRNLLIAIVIEVLLRINCLSQTMQQTDTPYLPGLQLTNEVEVANNQELLAVYDTVLIDTALVSLQEWLASRGMDEDVTINSNLEELYQKVLEYYSEGDTLMMDIYFNELCDGLRANYGPQHLCHAIAQEAGVFHELHGNRCYWEIDKILPMLIDAHRIFGIYGRSMQQRRVERLMLRSLCEEDPYYVGSKTILLQADSILRLGLGDESREYLFCLGKMAKIADRDSEELALFSQGLYNRLIDTYKRLELPKDSLFVTSIIGLVENLHSPNASENLIRAVDELYDISWLPDSVYGNVIRRFDYRTDSLQKIYIYTKGKQLMESRGHTTVPLYDFYIGALVDEYWWICTRSYASHDYRQLLDVSSSFLEEFPLADEPFLDRLGLSEKNMDIVSYRIEALEMLGKKEEATHLSKEYIKVMKDQYAGTAGRYSERISRVWLYVKRIVEDFPLAEKLETERFFLGEGSRLFQQTTRELAARYVSSKNFSDAIRLMESFEYKDAETLYRLSEYYEAYGDRKKSVDCYYQLYDMTRKLQTPYESILNAAAVFYIGRYADNSEKKSRVIHDYVKAFAPDDYDTFSIFMDEFMFEIPSTEWEKLYTKWYKRHRKKLSAVEMVGLDLLKIEYRERYSLLENIQLSPDQLVDSLLAVYNGDDQLSKTVRLFLYIWKENNFINNNPEQALAMNDEELKLLKTFQDYESLYEYRQFLARRSYALFKLGRIQKASEVIIQYIQHINDKGRTLPNSDIFGYTLRSAPLIADDCFAFILAKTDKTDLALKLFSEMGKNFIDRIKTNDEPDFSPLYGNLHTIVYGAAAMPSDTLSSLAYDASMISKAYAITAGKNIERIVTKSSDSTLVDKYHEMQLTLSLLDTNRDTLIIDSLRKRISLLRTQIYYDTSKSDNVNEAFNVSWRQVAKKLKDGQVAIEFMRYRTNVDPWAKDTIRYCAAVINGGSRHPQIIDLCSDSQLIGIKNPYEGHTVYNLIWKPLAGYIKDAGDVFFAPDGQLLRIAIENVSDDNGLLLSGRHRLHRLTSTRIMIEDRHLSSRDAVLFGGLTYYYPENDWTSVAEDGNLQEEPISKELRSIYDHYRGAVNYLSGTLEEVEKIDQLLQMQRIHASLYTDREGTESQFKQLSGTKAFRLLHLATHGFYVPDDSAHLNQARFIDRMALRTSNYDSEDNSLSRSGLFLSGSANVMSEQGRNQISVMADDGILTAKEISRLQLPTDLVVLSACETALGDITGDGVFGLQRGFKKAGAQSILMSLWKVDDEATCLLMTEFYKHWIGEGKTKHDALELAKQTVRSHKEKGWDNPEYWAAFILLDGLE